MTTPEAYRDEFAARVRKARVDAGYTQQEIADCLKIAQPNYSKYEGRLNESTTLMPHHLIEKFALITEVSVAWLLTGHEAYIEIADLQRRVAALEKWISHPMHA